MKQVVKHGGRVESYSQRKIYASVYASVVAAQDTPQTADEIAHAVTDSIDSWLQKKHEVTSDDLRRHITDILIPIHAKAGYLYKHHRILW